MVTSDMDLYLVELTVADWPASLAWYRDRLGLTVEKLDEPNRYALLTAGPTQIALKAGMPLPASTRLTFYVADLDAELTRLVDRGLTPSTPNVSPEGYRSVKLTDPDGHRLELFEWIPPNPSPPQAV
ncbi:MAG TPA: VOC family protein [Gemmataceae bacterium]|nr:VOC family protein [Gemmataceae bacterium]